jgi:hypothetical protein
MPELADQIEAARAELARLERIAAHASCADLGCRMVSTGGANCGCVFLDDEDHELPGSCSVPVNYCERCGDCDYGNNDDATEIRRVCREMNPDLHEQQVEEVG